MLAINLLSPEQKKEIRLEKRKRLAFFLSGFCVAVLFVLSVLLLPSLILSYFQLSAVKNQIAVERSLAETKKVQLLESKIDQISKLIFDLEKIQSKTKKVSSFLDSLSSDLPVGSRLADFSFNGANNEIIIRGYSPDRDSFLTFKDSLEKDKNFKGLVSPFSNIIKDKNIDFTLTFYLNQ